MAASAKLSAFRDRILLPLDIEPPIVQGRRDLRGGKWQRITARRSPALDGQASRALVISLLKGETTAVEAARRHGLKVAEVEEWRDRFLLGAENALRARQKEDEALREEEINRLKRKSGEQRWTWTCARGREAPYDAGDVRRVIATWPGVSMRGVCRVLKFSRARLPARA